MAKWWRGERIDDDDRLKRPISSSVDQEYRDELKRWRRRYAPRVVVSFSVLALVVLAVGVGLPFADGLADGLPVGDSVRRVPSYWETGARRVWDNVTIEAPASPTAAPVAVSETVADQSPESTPTNVLPTERALLMESLIHALVNAERQQAGLAPLSTDDLLSSVARSHSADMASRDYFDHVNTQGQHPSDRAASAGYSCRKDYGTYYTDGVAENIAQNWLFSSITTIGPISTKNYMSNDEIAQETVEGWMNSPGHRANILEADYDRVGTGVAIAEDQKVYLTQNFC